jgi:rubrerythrin
MTINFNADEIFEMAEQIERNASKFYLEAARKTSEEAMQKMFIDLAAMEDSHVRIFQEMRNKLSASEREPMLLDPDNEAALYLQTMADSHGSEGKRDLKTRLTGKEPMEEVLAIAVNAEKNSIVFYTVLKGLISPEGKDKVEAIIDEEIGHLAVLKMQLAKLS